MASSATVVWSEAGRSKVEEMTSPATVRSMSVTSSGRSSTSTTIRCTSGLFVVIALAMFCSVIVLPAFGGETIRPRWPLPIGGNDVHDAAGELVRRGLLLEALLRVQRGELGELRAVGRLFDAHAVDGVDGLQRHELLALVAAVALARRADGSGHGVAPLRRPYFLT